MILKPYCIGVDKLNFPIYIYYSNNEVRLIEKKNNKNYTRQVIKKTIK